MTLRLPRGMYVEVSDHDGVRWSGIASERKYGGWATPESPRDGSSGTRQRSCPARKSLAEVTW